MVEQVLNQTCEQLRKLQWGKIFHMFYIEPVLFLLVFAHSLSGTIVKNEIISLACANVFHYNISDCRQLGTKNISAEQSGIETEIQPYAANLFMLRTILESIVPAICGVFIGSWSDQYGRKPLLVISMIGFSCTYVITAVICEIARYYPVNPWYYILAVVPHSILGGNCVFSVAAFCFIADVTTPKARPYRMIFMEVFFFVGLTSGSLLSSFVFKWAGATVTFAISAIMMWGATIYIGIWVPESLNYELKDTDEETEKESKDAKDSIDSIDNKDSLANKDNNKNIVPLDKCCFKDIAVLEVQEIKEIIIPNSTKSKDTKSLPGLFSMIHIKDMLITCFKERPFYDRCIIWLVTGTMFISIFIFDGVVTVFYLFVREKFHWTVRDYTIYETVSHSVPMIGGIFGFLIMRRLFKMSVVSLTILSFASDFLCNIVRGLGTEDWHLYLALGFGVFRSISGPMCRTMISNIVPGSDLGKIFSIKNVLQSIAPFVSAPLYTVIYKASLSTYPGLFNFVSAGLQLIALMFMIIVLRLKFTYKEPYAKTLK